MSSAFKTRFVEPPLNGASWFRPGRSSASRDSFARDDAHFSGADRVRRLFFSPLRPTKVSVSSLQPLVWTSNVLEPFCSRRISVLAFIFPVDRFLRSGARASKPSAPLNSARVFKRNENHAGLFFVKIRYAAVDDTATDTPHAKSAAIAGVRTAKELVSSLLVFFTWHCSSYAVWFAQFMTSTRLDQVHAEVACLPRIILLPIRNVSCEYRRSPANRVVQ